MTRTLALLASLALATAARADDPKKPSADVEKAQKQLAEYLKTIPGADAGRVTPLAGDGIEATFPDHVLFGVLFGGTTPRVVRQPSPPDLGLHSSAPCRS